MKILNKNDYEKQGGIFFHFFLIFSLESIITWNEKDINEEIALSFLDNIAANETW